MVDISVFRFAGITILLIWIFSITMASLPLFHLFGEYGYDAVTGECRILNCSLPNGLNIHIPASGVTLTLGVGLPCLISFAAYIQILQSFDDSKSEEKTQLNEILKVTTILISCYVVFILPTYIIQWVPFSEDFYPLISLFIFLWYFLIYIINAFVYIICGPRCRDAIRLFLRDLKNFTISSRASQKENTSDFPMGKISECNQYSI